MIKKLLLYLLLMFIPVSVLADSKKDNIVNVYLFYSESCSYCSMERKLFNDLKKKYDNLNVYEYNVDDNMELFEEVSTLFKIEVTGVPCVFIGDKIYKGFSYQESKKKFMAVIDYYSQYGYRDIVGEHIGILNLPSYEINNDMDIDEYISNYGNYEIRLLGRNINTKNLDLIEISILIGISDSFNINILLFMIIFLCFLIVVKKREDVWKLFFSGVCILIVSFVIILFILDKVKVYLLILEVVFVTLLLIIGFIRLHSYFKKDCFKDKFSLLLDKYNYVINLLLISIISILGISCLFYNNSNILILNIMELYNMMFLEKIVYIFMYVFFNMITYLLVIYLLLLFIQRKNIDIKYNKFFMLSSSICMIIIGICKLFV